MKVLYITNIPAPYKVSFFNELGKLCDLTVIFERDKASDRDGSWYSFDNANYQAIFIKSISISNDSSMSLSIVMHLMKNEYDIIIFGAYHTITSITTMAYLKFRRVPFALSSDGGFVKIESSYKRIIKRKIIGMAEWYLSPGGDTDNYLIHYGAIKNKIYKYPFTSLAQEDILSSQEFIDLRKKDSDEIVIISVGQLIRRKGFDILFRALEGIPNVRLLIAGGNRTEEYDDIISECELNNVEFLGFLSRNELFKYYRHADAFILPTREDIWGLVVVEAMGNGLPVITTNRCNAGIELLMDGFNGYIAKAGSIESLRSVLKELLSGDLEKMGNNSLDSIQNYSYRNMALKHITAVRSMLGEV